jgi:hypothetical protein
MDTCTCETSRLVLTRNFALDPWSSISSRSVTSRSSTRPSATCGFCVFARNFIIAAITSAKMLPACCVQTASPMSSVANLSSRFSSQCSSNLECGKLRVLLSLVRDFYIKPCHEVQPAVVPDCPLSWVMAQVLDHILKNLNQANGCRPHPIRRIAPPLLACQNALGHR